jgi:hypothetical protein
LLKPSACNGARIYILWWSRKIKTVEEIFSIFYLSHDWASLEHEIRRRLSRNMLLRLCESKEARSKTIELKTVFFRDSRVAWRFQAPIRFPAVKQGLILKEEAEKALIWSSLMSESHWWNLFCKKWRAETLQPGLEFDNFKPQLKSGIFKCISWLKCSFIFGGDDQGFLKAGVKTYLIAPMSPLNNSPTCFFLSSAHR